MIKFMPVTIVSLLALTGCGFTKRGDVVREAVATKAGEVSRQTLKNNVEYMCEFARVGAVRDEFGTTQELFDAYDTMCKARNNNAGPIQPPVE